LFQISANCLVGVLHLTCSLAERHYVSLSAANQGVIQNKHGDRADDGD
jgi:hypothetical protein